MLKRMLAQRASAMSGVSEQPNRMLKRASERVLAQNQMLIITAAAVAWLDSYYERKKPKLLLLCQTTLLQVPVGVVVEGLIDSLADKSSSLAKAQVNT